MTDSSIKNEVWEVGEAVRPLPCLNSNNSIETFKYAPELSSYQKKSLRTHEDNIARFISLHGVERCLFVTLTFVDFVTDMKEAQRRFNSLSTNFLKSISPNYLSVKERHKSGQIHYHMLIAVGEDIRTGFEHDVVFSKARLPRKIRYASACPFLKELWKLFRENLPLYGFGRSELAPVKTNSEGISKYLTKYLVKGYAEKNPEYPDKGVRMINYSTKWLRNSVKFSWNTEGGKAWRSKVAKFARLCLCSNLDELAEKLGNQWAYQYQDFIMAVDESSGAALYDLLDHLSEKVGVDLTTPERYEGEQAKGHHQVEVELEGQEEVDLYLSKHRAMGWHEEVGKYSRVITYV